MAATTALLDPEQTASMTRQDVPTLRLDRHMTPGTLRLVTAPMISRTSEAPTFTATHVSAPCAADFPRRHAYVSPRCCDVAVAVLILLIAAVALYPLIWIGQP